MKYFLPLFLLTSLFACDKEEQASAITIRLTNETSHDLFGLENYMAENVYGDLAINASSSHDLEIETEFPRGEVYPEEQKAKLADGSYISIRSAGYCGTGLTYETVAPGIYEFSIQFLPDAPFDPENGDFGIVEAHYAFVPKQ